MAPGRIVELDLRAVDGGALRYAYNGWADGSGALRIALPDAGATATWTRRGDGRLDWGPWDECWDERRVATYARFPTDAGVGTSGDERACPAAAAIRTIP